MSLDSTNNILKLGMPMPFLDVGLKNMSEHRMYRAINLCCGCSLPCYTVLNEDMEKTAGHSEVSFDFCSLGNVGFHVFDPE